MSGRPVDWRTALMLLGLHRLSRHASFEKVFAGSPYFLNSFSYCGHLPVIGAACAGVVIRIPGMARMMYSATQLLAILCRFVCGVLLVVRVRGLVVPGVALLRCF